MTTLRAASSRSFTSRSFASRTAASLTAASLAALLACAGCSSSDASSDTSAESNLGESEAPLARFHQYTSSLRNALDPKKTVDEMAQALLASGRPNAFSLQALARVYKKADPKFKELERDFKGLEDGIGQYAKWDEIYQAAVSQKKDQATLDRLKSQRDAALVAFTKLLSERGWRTEGGKATRLDDIEAFLEGFDWKTRKEDRTFVLDELKDELEDIAETKYDMKILEYGDGVHEIRRDIRWILISQLALNGMVTANKASCAIPAYKDLPTSDRYVLLKTSNLEPNPCQIDACVVAAAAKAVNEIGSIKDAAEQQVNINGEDDVVPADLQPKAQAIYDELTKNNLFGVYKDQMKACKDAL